MKKINKVTGFILVIAVCVFTSIASHQDDSPDKPDNFGGGEFIFENTECITDADRNDIWEHINENTEMLIKQGKIVNNPDAIVQLQWPLRKGANLTDPGYYGISN